MPVVGARRRRCRSPERGGGIEGLGGAARVKGMGTVCRKQILADLSAQFINLGCPIEFFEHLVPPIFNGNFSLSHRLFCHLHFALVYFAYAIFECVNVCRVPSLYSFSVKHHPEQQNSQQTIRDHSQ